MKEELSFDLQDFREAQNVVQKMQDEFCRLAKEKICQMDSFDGHYVRYPTGANAGKVAGEVFFSKVDVAGLSVDLTMNLNWYPSHACYGLESFEMCCDELSIRVMIDRKTLHDFHIFFTKGDIRYKYRVYAH